MIGEERAEERGESEGRGKRGRNSDFMTCLLKKEWVTVDGKSEKEGRKSEGRIV